MTDDSQEAIFRQLEERLLQPHVRKSEKDVAALLADEFIEFGSSGRVFNKQQTIESLQNEVLNPTAHLTLTDFNALVLATGVTLVTYRIDRHSSSGEKLSSSLRSSVWKLTDSKWKIVFHQGTLTKE